MSKIIKINGHGHLLPNPEQIPKFMKEKKIFWIDDDRKFMRQGDWKRPVTDASFFLEEKLLWMERNDIRHEVVLNLSQLYCNGMEQNQCRDVIRFQNDFNASIQNENPEKFTTGFVVQVAFVEDALKEIRRCVEDLKMNLLCLPTHFLNSKGQWASTASKEVEPIWALANHYKLAVEIHPYDGPRMIALQDQFWRFHLVWMCAQTADNFHCFSLLNFPEKFSKLRTCFAHGNQFGQMNLGRRIQGFEGRPDLFKDAVHPKKNICSNNVYFDTLVHDVYSFRLLLDRQGSSQIVAGLDDPYPLGEMETVPNCFPGKVIEEALEKEFITKKERQEIWLYNVVKWLCGDDSTSFYKRTKIQNESI